MGTVFKATAFYYSKADLSKGKSVIKKQTQSFSSKFEADTWTDFFIYNTKMQAISFLTEILDLNEEDQIK